jgi:hypothetical protein
MRAKTISHFKKPGFMVSKNETWFQKKKTELTLTTQLSRRQAAGRRQCLERRAGVVRKLHRGLPDLPSRGRGLPPTLSTYSL